MRGGGACALTPDPSPASGRGEHCDDSDDVLPALRLRFFSRTREKVPRRGGWGLAGTRPHPRPLSRARERGAKTQAARRSDSVSDSMLAALGLTSQNLPM
ncbi:UNVERIFIED_ORG: hypothetical protein ABIB63_001941 [Xanthomonas axonopodis]